MIEQNAFGLKDAGIDIVESSEQGMLAQVERADNAGEAIVFLGWEPHPMNAKFQMSYLTGGDDFFGPDRARGETAFEDISGQVTLEPDGGTAAFGGGAGDWHRRWLGRVD